MTRPLRVAKQGGRARTQPQTLIREGFWIAHQRNTHHAGRENIFYTKNSANLITEFSAKLYWFLIVGVCVAIRIRVVGNARVDFEFNADTHEI